VELLEGDGSDLASNLRGNGGAGITDKITNVKDLIVLSVSVEVPVVG